MKEPLRKGGTVASSVHANEVMPPFEHLHTTALRELGRHQSTGGNCVACDSRWPCDQLCLAIWTLGVLSGDNLSTLSSISDGHHAFLL